MSKHEELERLWSELRRIDKELSVEAKECSRKGSMTDRYLNLKRDADKVRVEYEKLKGGGQHDPMSLDSGERVTTRKVIGDMTGRTGGDSHMRQED